MDEGVASQNKRDELAQEFWMHRNTAWVRSQHCGKCSQQPRRDLLVSPLFQPWREWLRDAGPHSKLASEVACLLLQDPGLTGQSIGPGVISIAAEESRDISSASMDPWHPSSGIATGSLH